MKHIKVFEQFVNEAANLPKEAKELAKMFKGGSWKPHFDLNDVWIFNSSELKDVDLQINWNSSEDWGNIGFQIADEDGNEIYTGKDPKKAAASIKSNEQFVNEGLSEKAQQFIKICQLISDKNEKDPVAVESLIIDHGWSNAKLKDITSKLENL